MTTKNENIEIEINTNFYSFIISELLTSDPRTDSTNLLSRETEQHTILTFSEPMCANTTELHHKVRTTCSPFKNIEINTAELRTRNLM